MFDFMAQAQTAHQMHQDAFQEQYRIHEQMVHQVHIQSTLHASTVHQDNASYIDGLRSKIAKNRQTIAEQSAEFDKEWEAHRKAIRDFDINDFSQFN